MRIDLTKPIQMEFGPAVLDNRRIKMSQLSQLDINTHSTFQVLRWLQETRNFTLQGKNVIAIGSHDFLEHDGFVHYGANDIWAFECNPFVFPDLEKRTKYRENTHIYQECLWSESGLEKELYFFRDQKYGASSLYPNEKLTDYVPECKQLNKTVKLTTTTLDDFLEKRCIILGEIGFVNLDVQGSELEVLKGAKTLMNSEPEIFYVEVSWDNLYKNAPLINEIDQFFTDYNYVRIGLRTDISVQGDAIYVKSVVK